MEATEMQNKSGELGFGGHWFRVGTEKQRLLDLDTSGMMKNMSNKCEI